jgi:transcriptional regulator with XRE-family HTH domain
MNGVVEIMEHTIGMELRLKRVSMRLNMIDIANQVGVSENFISEIERDKKIPADEKIVYRLAEAYELESEYLFRRFEKVPSVITEELKNQEYLADIVYTLSNDNRLTDCQKETIYKKLHEIVSDTLDELETENDLKLDVKKNKKKK